MSWDLELEILENRINNLNLEMEQQLQTVTIMNQVMCCSTNELSNAISDLFCVKKEEPFKIVYESKPICGIVLVLESFNEKWGN